MAKNFYIVLGVPREASRRRIKQAYRDLVKQHHPDIGGPEADPERFRDIQQAYETLGDSDRRALYDQDLNWPSHLHPTRHVTEIRPKDTFRSGFGAKQFQEGDLFHVRPRGLGLSARSGHLANEIVIEMILEPSEALQGGLFPMSVPAVIPCESCYATGSMDSAICNQCLGRAQVQAERRFYVHIPSNVEDGTTAVLSLDAVGLNGLYLRLFIRVAVMDLF
jgi:molecular chaperone DnaJ